MIRYKLTFAYNGRTFSGWQSQPQLTSIQDHLEKQLRLIVSTTTSRITAASRTDSGVHAEEQIAIFDSESELDTYKILKSLNSLIRPHIFIYQLEKTDLTFNPIGACTGKIYRYRILQNGLETPFFSEYVWPVKKPLNIAVMNAVAEKLRGTFDFTAFCASDSNAKTKHRKIFECYFEQKSDFINFWISGEGFLKQMVRSLVGTIVEIGKNNLDANKFFEYFTSGVRDHGVKTAPANGLSLVKLFYGECDSISNLIKRAENGFNQAL